MRKALKVGVFFIFSPILLVFSLIFLSFLSYQKFSANSFISFYVPPKTVSYAALPSSDELFVDKVTVQDARVEIVRQFFQKYNSPLEPYAEAVVKSADTHGLDFRLIPAIAMQESNLCKRIPIGSNNCWGYGIYADKVRTFESYGEGIEVVTESLSRKYKKGNGLVTPEQIMTMYTPGSNGSWARGVNFFMDQLQ